MAHPRVFVSSTYYDLKHLRSSLENFIEALGYEPVLSEKGNIAYAPDTPLDESCYREVHNADIFVLIVGGRYGSERSGGESDLPKHFFDKYDSITKQEYKSAVAQDIPIYILIERSVYADFENFLRNKDNQTFSYAHVDSINVFHLIEEILAQPQNNPFYLFDRYSDIEIWLKEQWAGLFRELLSRISNQQRLLSLAAQVESLAETNKTLKRYLEELLVSEIPSEKSEDLINTEDRRLADAQRDSYIKNYGLNNYLMDAYDIKQEAIHKAMHESRTLKEFLERIANYSNLTDADKYRLFSIRDLPEAIMDYDNALTLRGK